MISTSRVLFVRFNTNKTGCECRGDRRSRVTGYKDTTVMFTKYGRSTNVRTFKGVRLHKGQSINLKTNVGGGEQVNR